MANGDFITIDYDQIRVKLLDAQVAADNGVWVEIPGGYTVKTYWASNLEEGAADATVDIMVSNAETKPADATDGTIDLAMTTSTMAGTKQNTYRWIKAKKATGTTPAATTIILIAGRST